jgi:hypothetical protein
MQQFQYPNQCRKKTKQCTAVMVCLHPFQKRMSPESKGPVRFLLVFSKSDSNNMGERES